ncbi:MAG: hypothetical protein MJ137_09005 [Clostridia bacterium]|nr:hypothetical protein [Clostridia bacterium]
MKRALSILMFSLIVVSILVSCESTGDKPPETSFYNETSSAPNQPDLSLNNNQSMSIIISPDQRDPYKLELTPDRTNLPKYSVLQEIKQGMTLEEVRLIAGHPQRTETHRHIYDDRSSTLDVTFYIYDSLDGPSISILYVFSDSTLSDLIVGSVEIWEGAPQSKMNP